MQSSRDERKWKDSSLFQDSSLSPQMFHLEINCLPNVPIFTNLNVKSAFAHSANTYPIELEQGSAKVQNRDISVGKRLESPWGNPHSVTQIVDTVCNLGQVSVCF